MTCHAGSAVTAGAQVGLDVEETQRHTHGDPLRLARRRFSPKEIAGLEGGPPDAPERFQAQDPAHNAHPCREVQNATAVPTGQAYMRLRQPSSFGGECWMVPLCVLVLCSGMRVCGHDESCLCWVPGCAEGPERARHFVRLWTLKEAYVKAVGRGIGARPGLRAFSMVLEPSSDGTPLQTPRYWGLPMPPEPCSNGTPLRTCLWAFSVCLKPSSEITPCSTAVPGLA